MSKTWIVTFAYSGSNSRQFFDKEFEVLPGEDVNAKINKYVHEQNAGEAKSDRIRFWSMKLKPLPNE